MPIEIVVKKTINGHRILDYDIKDNDHEKVIKVSDRKFLINYLIYQKMLLLH